MHTPSSRPAPNSNRRTALTGCGLIAVIGVGVVSLWWTAAMKTPVVVIPNPVLPNPNAFDFYVRAGNAVIGDKQIGDAVSTKPTGVYSLAQKEALVQQNLGAIKTLHEGFAYPYVNPPARSASALFPYYAKFRGMARLLSLQGQVRAAQGDWNSAAESYMDAIRMGEDIPHGSVLIGDLVGIACQAIGRRPMWGTLEHLNASQTRAACGRLESIMARHFPYSGTLREEKYFGQAAMLELFADEKKRNAALAGMDEGETSGHAKQALSSLMYLVYSKNRIMNNHTTYMDRSAALADQPYGLHLPPPPLPNDPINSILLPIFSQARLKDVETQTQNGLLLITLALHAFKLEHGHYPAALTEMTPAYVKQLPDDPFAAKGTFQYHNQGESYTLYSIGPDGKDDGGTAIDDPKQANSSNPNSRYFVNENSVGDVVAGKNLY
jgi:type II secretory pathway pseudopilin PulG